jgi:molybdate transport system regulatory protein
MAVMRIRTKVWLEDEEGNAVFGEGRKRILELIDEKGSLSEAARALKMSYRAVWGKVHSTEERLGTKLVVTRVGSRHGGAELTPRAKKLVHAYNELLFMVQAQSNRIFHRVFGE